MRTKLVFTLICLCWSSNADRELATPKIPDDAEKSAKPRWVVSDRVVKAERISLFLRGSSTSNEITQVLKDLHDIKKPASRYLPRRLDKNPSQSVDFIETICKQNGASMFGFGSSTKRRRNNLLLGRLYNGKVLDSFEFQARSIKSSKKIGADVSTDSRPCFVFLGECWTNDNTLNEFKNYLIDCLGVRHDKHVSLQALSRVIVCSAFNSTRVEIRHFVNQIQVHPP
jgi:ribosome production factor 2